MALHRETIEPRGPFSLRAAAQFGFGPTEGAPPSFDGALRMAFAVDGGRGHAGAVLRQRRDDDPIDAELTLTGAASPERALAQVARTLSLDDDGDLFLRVGELHDPVLAALQRAHPGQRPVLFYSPYEAAGWAIVSARRPAAQAARVRDAVAESLGSRFELAGRTVHAFPQPDGLARIPDGFTGLNQTKIDRLRALAALAQDGPLEVDAIHAQGYEIAYEEVQRLPGIGPFYAALIVLRASGFADAWLPGVERRGTAHLAAYYGLGDSPTDEQLQRVADGWRPFRTWAMVLVRLAGDRGTRI